MAECQRCTAKSQTVLCNRCTTHVIDMLTELPWWIDRLTETAIGHAALGTPARRTRRERNGLHGDDTLASHIEVFPDETEQDLGEARRARYIAAQRHALAAGGINPGAAELLDTITNMLSTWIRDICETRGIPTPKLATCARMAGWLIQHITAIANHPGADEFADELDQRLHEIRRVINRPTAPQFCGPCPHYVEHNRHCGKMIYASHHATHVTCDACRTTHSVERLTTRLEARADVMRFTGPEILTVMKTLGKPIPERTWLRWRKENRVKIRGYKRPDNADGTRGAIRLTRKNTDDEPVYRLAEVRKIQQESIRHADALTCRKTGT